MRKNVRKFYYEINSEKCNRNRGAVSEVLGIKKFIEKLSIEKGCDCVGVIRVCSGFWEEGTVTISEKNEIVSKKNIVEHLEKRNNYGIKMFVLVSDGIGFEKEIENYLHNREEDTVSHKRLVFDSEDEKFIEKFFSYDLYEQIFTLDCYGKDLDGYASSFVNKIENYNFNRYNDGYRLFGRYHYGNDGVINSSC